HEAIECAMELLVTVRRWWRLAKPFDELRRDQLLPAKAIAKLHERLAARLVALIAALRERRQRIVAAIELLAQHLGEAPSHSAHLLLVTFHLDQPGRVLGHHA